MPADTSHNQRTPICAGNWKLHHNLAASRELAQALKAKSFPSVELIVAPVFTALSAVHAELKNTPVQLAAQNCYWEAKGAFTGEVSAELLKDVGCSHVIIGHSERRTLFGERDEDVAKKISAVQNAGLIPILCVGETLSERKENKSVERVRAQLHAALAKPARVHAANLVIAYEPVWAIGTGINASPDDAQAIHQMIRAELKTYDSAQAHHIRVIYGGSVKAENASALYQMPDIDGFLVGGASLDAGSFSAIISAIADLSQQKTE